jgi:hypothetical protein
MPNKTKKNMKKIRGGDPTLSSNINKAASIGMQLGNDLVSIGLNKVAELTGQNPNLPLDKSIKEIGNKLEGVQKALETKEGEKILNNLGKLAGEVGEDIVGPAIEKASNVVLEKSGEIGNKAVSAGIDVLAATPIAPLIEIPKFVSDVSTGVMKSAEAASDVLSIGSDSIKELKEKQEKASGIIADLQNLVENSGETLNKGLNSGLNMVESKTKELNDYVDKNTKNIGNKIKNANPLKTINDESLYNLKKIQKGGKIVENRVNKSQLEFLSPHVTRDKILRQLKRWSTKKNKKRVHRRSARRV